MPMTDNAVSSKLQLIPHGFEPWKQFINWKPEQQGVKIEKVPCSSTGANIDPHNPANWLTAEEAAASQFGIAFVFTERDPFVFIDLDHAVERIGQSSTGWTAIAKNCFEWFPGAAFEISHSGEGAHIFFSGSSALPRDHRCRRKGLDLEVYTSGRFVALTGTGKAGSALADFGARLPQFMAGWNLDGTQTERDADLAALQRDPSYTGPEDDDELIRLMCGSAGGAAAAFGGVHVRDIWQMNSAVLAQKWPAAGRQDGLPYDASAVDGALMSHLGFWTGRDVDRMERLFQRWPGYRAKKYEGKGAYRMNKALALGVAVRSVYNKPRADVVPLPGAAAAPGAPSETPVENARDKAGFMGLEGQQQHFAGCVYVADRHSVLTPDGRLLRPEMFRAEFGGYQFTMDHAGKTTRSAFEAFTESRLTKFRKAKTVRFSPRDPAGDIDAEGAVNMWVPPDVKMAEGDVTPFLVHVAKMLPVERDRQILFAYMQAVVQFPGVKFQWAPVIQGCEGNGKSLLIRCLVRAVSRRYSHLPKASELSEKFNSYLEGNIFIGVEEVNVSEKRETLEVLKDAVTNDWIEIRGMQREKKMANNYTNWFFCTNHRDAIPTNTNDRRYAIFYAAQQAKSDLDRDGMTVAYFRQLYDWLNAVGYEHVAYWLKHTPIHPEFNPAGACQRAPETSSTGEAIRETLGKLEQLIMEAVEEGAKGFRNDWLSSWAVLKLFNDRGQKAPANNKIGAMIKSLGYSIVLKPCSAEIPEEGNKRPTIYGRNGRTGTQDDYMKDQGYGPPPVFVS